MSSKFDSRKYSRERGPLPPIRKVVGSVPDGKNVMVTLECGHAKLFRGKARPQRTHCPTCQDLAE